MTGGPASPREPLERDRFIDLLRVLSILAVVVGHWLVAHLGWDGGRLTLESSLGASPGLWPLTWLLQVMPLFFFVGGFSNWASLDSVRRRGGGYAAFVDRRFHRLLAPTALYVTVAAVVSVVGSALGGPGLGGAAEVLTQPLWFLGVYVVVVALTPVTLAWHRVWGWRAPALLAAVASVTDLVRFGLDVEGVAYLNTLTVWVMVTQLGYLYRDGRLDRRRAAWIGAAGFSSLCVLVAFGPYPARMVGVPGDPFSNMNPPTLVISALAVWQVGTAVWLRDRVRPSLESRRVWTAVVAVNLSVMSVYLWHQAAMLTVARVGLPAGLPQPDPGTGGWWLTRLLWLALSGGLLAGIVALVRRAEQSPAPAAAPPSGAGTVAAVAAVVQLGIGLLVLAGTVITVPFEPKVVLGGLHVVALVGLFHVLVAAGLMRGGRGGARRAAGALWLAAVSTALAVAALRTGVGPLEALPGLAGVEAGLAVVLALGALTTRPAGRGSRLAATGSGGGR